MDFTLELEALPLSCLVGIFYCGNRHETKTIVRSECSTVYLNDF